MKPVSKSSGKANAGKTKATSNTPPVKSSKDKPKVKGKAAKPGAMIGNSSSIKGCQK